MQKKIAFILSIWLGFFTLIGCQNSVASSQSTISPTPTPTVQEGSDYWGLVKQAQEAYTQADYETAKKLARQAVSLNPDDETGWDLYSQATIALAGDSYLSGLPETRYQYPIPVYVRDVVNHSRSWVVIDVREPDEYDAGHIDGALNLPLRELLDHLYQLPNSKSAPILLYCHSQKRATHALVVLHELGYLKVFNLEGGYAAYESWMNSNPLPTPGPTPTPGPDEPDLGC